MKKRAKRGTKPVATSSFIEPQRPPMQEDLTKIINSQVKKLKLTQVQAGNRLGLKQPAVSRLMNGRHDGFSVERLIKFLNILDQDVMVTIKPKPQNARRIGIVKVSRGS